jgi:hypothetical protein
MSCSIARWSSSGSTTHQHGACMAHTGAGCCGRGRGSPGRCSTAHPCSWACRLPRHVVQHRSLVQLGLDHASARCMHGPYGCWLLWTRPGPTRALFSRSPVILCVSFTAPYRAYLARWSSSGPFTLSTLHAWPVRVLPALDAARAHPGADFSLACDPVRVVYRAMSCLPRALVQLEPVHASARCMARTGRVLAALDAGGALPGAVLLLTRACGRVVYRAMSRSLARWSSSGPFRHQHAACIARTGRVLAALDAAGAHPGAVLLLTRACGRVVYRAMSCSLARWSSSGPFRHQHAACMARTGRVLAALDAGGALPGAVLLLTRACGRVVYRAMSRSLARWSSSGPFRHQHAACMARTGRVLAALDAARAHPDAVLLLTRARGRVVYRAMSCNLARCSSSSPFTHQHAACMHGPYGCG